MDRSYHLVSIQIVCLLFFCTHIIELQSYQKAYHVLNTFCLETHSVHLNSRIYEMNLDFSLLINFLTSIPCCTLILFDNMHLAFVLQDKPSLFKSFFKWLKPGGKVLISDYCRSPGKPSEEFAAYIKQRGYDLHDVEAYGQVLISI